MLVLACLVLSDGCNGRSRTPYTRMNAYSSWVDTSSSDCDAVRNRPTTSLALIAFVKRSANNKTTVTSVQSPYRYHNPSCCRPLSLMLRSCFFVSVWAGS